MLLKILFQPSLCKAQERKDQVQQHNEKYLKRAHRVWVMPLTCLHRSTGLKSHDAGGQIVGTQAELACLIISSCRLARWFCTYSVLLPSGLSPMPPEVSSPVALGSQVSKYSKLKTEILTNLVGWGFVDKRGACRTGWKEAALRGTGSG